MNHDINSHNEKLVDNGNTPPVIINDMPAVSNSYIPMDESLPVHTEAKKITVPKWASRVAVGSLVIGGAYALYANPLEETKDAIVDSAPWVVGGIATSEALWVGGACMSLYAAGKKVRISKDFKSNFKSELSGTTNDVLSNSMFKTGLHINTLGAVGTAAVIGTAAVAKLPPETWPGALGLATLDIAGTFALRAPLYKGIDVNSSKKEKMTSAVVREATIADIERLADIDLSSFESSYGDNPPAKKEVIAMLTSRFNNMPGWMFVIEKAGQVEGFVTAFRSNKSAEEFESWESTTNHGTLEGVVDPNGRYAYVVNLTINRESNIEGAKNMLLANIFAKGIAEGGLEYGYFESRMPGFSEWVQTKDKTYSTPEELDELAQEYSELRDDKGKRIDWQLRMYESDGFKLGSPVSGAFKDEASLNYGVVCKSSVPMGRAPKIVRIVVAKLLKRAAKNPKILEKIL